MVGIATFHKSINNGSVLQAWALQQFLMSYGYQNEVINYKPKYYDDLYSYFNSWTSIRNIIKNIPKLLYYPMVKMQRESYYSFRTTELIESKATYFHNSNFEKLNEEYDAIICGSDQIWNIRIKDCDPFYFLPIKHRAKKIAYAASINNADFLSSELANQYRMWINDFDYISIREQSGAERVKELLPYKPVHVMPDPTLLLEKKVYGNLISKRIVNEPYVFLYCVAYRESTIEAAVEISKKLNLPVYTMISGKSLSPYFLVIKNGIKVIKSHNGPKDFINYIQYADFVITNSFHGTAFSIIFEKEFISINDIGVDGNYRNDKRLTNILKEFNLLCRFVKKNDIASYNFDLKIDYGPITNKRLENASCIGSIIEEILGS